MSGHGPRHRFDLYNDHEVTLYEDAQRHVENQPYQSHHAGVRYDSMHQLQPTVHYDQDADRTMQHSQDYESDQVSGALYPIPFDESASEVGHLSQDSASTHGNQNMILYDNAETYQTAPTPSTLSEDQYYKQQIPVDTDFPEIYARNEDYLQIGVGMQGHYNGQSMIRSLPASYQEFLETETSPSWNSSQICSIVDKEGLPKLSRSWGNQMNPDPWTHIQSGYPAVVPADALFMIPPGNVYNRFHAGPEAGVQGQGIFRVYDHSDEPFGPQPPLQDHESSWQHQIPEDKLEHLGCDFMMKNISLPSGREREPSPAQVLHNDVVNSRRRGGRTRALEPEARTKVHKVRKKSACWRCFLQRNPCSLDNICGACNGTDLRTFPRRLLCDRSHFPDKLPFILPEIITSVHDQQQLMDFVNLNVEQWTSNCFEFHLTFGYGPPMLVQGIEFLPRGPATLSQIQFIKDENSEISYPVEKASPPLGLDVVSTFHMGKELNKHLDVLVNNHLEGWPAHCSGGEVNTLQRDVLQQVCAYYKEGAGMPGVLKQALKLHMLGYIMGRSLTLIEEEKEIIQLRLRYQGLGPYERFTCPRLANKQIKSVLCAMHQYSMSQLLENLEKLIRSRETSTWGSAFCVLILLAMMFEELQISIGYRIEAARIRNEDCRADGDAMAYCAAMDKNVFDWAVDIFHARYKTESKGRNPMEHGSKAYKVVDAETKRLIDGLRRLILQHGVFIRERQELRSNDPHQFLALNVSRLLSKLFLSFPVD
ncbi:MAG: hypothetical protein M1827_000680 [Pycnora praestabilis]|nr:MAG: hypothetical protein M1827_000680 [Pycnora praestabilis]